ncbi:MAG: hypothetical protein NVSMB2_25240 [Chloroflexota bacterium]
MMVWVPRVAFACAIVLIAARVPRFFTPQAADTLRAMRALGPIAGWRCVFVATYVYEPRTEQADAALLAERPELVVTEAHPEVTVQRAEVSLRGSDAVLWTSVGREAAIARVYVLSPAVRVAIGRPADRPVTCYAHQAGWTIVAEQNLQ